MRVSTAMIIGCVALLTSCSGGGHATSRTQGIDLAPPPAARPGTPCVDAKRISESRVASLRRPFHVVIPDDTHGIGNIKQAWTCTGTTGVFLQYDSGVTVMEDDSTPFDTDPGGAAGYFHAAAARGDGQQVKVAGFPGSVTVGDGHDPKGVVVQFIGGGDRIVVRTDDSSTDPAWLTAIALGIASQLV